MNKKVIDGELECCTASEINTFIEFFRLNNNLTQNVTIFYLQKFFKPLELDNYVADYTKTKTTEIIT